MIDLESLLGEAVAQAGVAGASLAVLADGQVRTAAAGVAHVGSQQPVRSDTLFQIGSIAKVYTATLVMQLVEEGVLDLDDRYGEHVPDRPFGVDAQETGGPTIGAMLNHTSGIVGDHFPDVGHGDEAIDRYTIGCASLDRLHEEGQAFSYCNAGFGALGLLLERLTGSRYRDLVRDRIGARLGTTTTVIGPDEAILHPVAVGHVAGDDGLVVAPVWSLGEGSAPAGSLTCATATDVLRFAAAHVDLGWGAPSAALLNPSTAAHMRRQTFAFTPPQWRGASGVGLGWLRYEGFGAPTLGHDGGTVGQAALLRVFPEHGAAICLLVNSVNADRVVNRVLPEVCASLDIDCPSPRAPTGDDRSAPLGRWGQPHVAIEIADGIDGPEATAIARDDSIVTASVVSTIQGVPVVPGTDGTWLLELATGHAELAIAEDAAGPALWYGMRRYAREA